MLRGLDHVVLAVRNLSRAAQAFADLGFTVTPENQHPWGTANRLVQLDGFFIELLSVKDADKIIESQNKKFSFGSFNRDFLQSHEGLSMLVLDSDNAEKDRLVFESAGLNLFEPFSFEREAQYPDGQTARVGFDLTFVEDPQSPNIGYFTCHNKYPGKFLETRFSTSREWRS